MGLMSGTSLDGVDAVLVDFSATPQSLGHAFTPFDAEFKKDLLALNSAGHNELHRANLASNRLADLYAKTCQALLHRLGISPQEVTALGAHGQTVRHQPQAHDAWGYSTQLLSAHLLAELTGIDVIHDFRSRDVFAGGQGAPLVPAFHQHIFSSPQAVRVVLNIGGMSNVSVLAPVESTANRAQSTSVTGFDCGPGNVLMDMWCFQHTGQAYDANGQWARKGVVQEDLLEQFLKEPFFQLKPPKSTGRDLFNEAWLHAQLAGPLAFISPADVQATLCALTAHSILQAVDAYLSECAWHQTAPSPVEMVLCGGGALNATLTQALKERADRFSSLGKMTLIPSEALGFPTQEVEAQAFAWLARQRVLGLSANLPQVTGAQGERILGSWIKA